MAFFMLLDCKDSLITMAKVFVILNLDKLYLSLLPSVLIF